MIGNYLYPNFAITMEHYMKTQRSILISRTPVGAKHTKQNTVTKNPYKKLLEALQRQNGRICEI